jgi:hypothetical protein
MAASLWGSHLVKGTAVMATCEDFLKWHERDLGRYGSLDEHAIIRVSGGSSEGLTEVSMTIFTDNNEYRIRAANAKPETATQQGHGAYLVAGALSRKPRAGEDWQRGNDLPDGPLTEETWRRILAAIVSYELVRVHKRDDLPAQGVPAVTESDEVGNAAATQPAGFPGIAA